MCASNSCRPSGACGFVGQHVHGFTPVAIACRTSGTCEPDIDALTTRRVVVLSTLQVAFLEQATFWLSLSPLPSPFPASSPSFQHQHRQF